MWRGILAFAAGAATITLAGARADEKSDALIERAKRVATATRSFRGEVATSIASRDRSAENVLTVEFLRPNYIRLRIATAQGQPLTSYYGTGTEWYTVLESAKQYLKAAAANDGRNLEMVDSPPPSPLGVLARPEGFAPTGERRYLGQREVNGKRYDVVEITSDRIPQRVTLYFAESGWLEGAERVFTSNGVEYRRTSWLRKYEVGPRLEPAQFTFTPGNDLRVYEPPRYDRDLIPVGQPAPDFTLPTPDGSRLTLSEVRRGKRAVLINFWFYGCGACRAELPHLQKLYEELASKGLEMIAVNRGDSVETVQRYIADSKFTFRVVMGGRGEEYTLGRAYGVMAYPTNYILDADGKVAWRGVGFGPDTEKQIREALARLGVK